MNPKTRKYKPGEILYVDSNFSRRYDCIGVVVSDDFWLEAVIKEGKYPEEIFREEFESEKRSLVRVLGTRSFRRYWDCNDHEFFDPNEEDVFNYISQLETYCVPIDLRPFLKVWEVARGRVFDLLFDRDYASRAISDAKLVYEYLDGERYEPSERGISRKEKFLRMLEKAIPLDKQ
jgi:hypothetical protein